MLNGIDIASHQGNINLAKVPADFVIIKATGGGGGGFGYVNPFCDSRYQLAKKSGKLLGFYHYAHEIGFQGSAIDEADFFIKNSKSYFGEAIPILDWESDNKHDVEWALTWLNRVYQKTGVKPWFYTYTNILQSYNFSSIAKAGYGLWVANYGSNSVTSGYRKPNPPFSPGFDITACFQYSSNTFLSEYGSRLDANVFYGDKKVWAKYAGTTVAESKPEPVKPTTPSKPTGGKIKMKTFTLTSDVYLRTSAKTSASTIALLKKGNKVEFNDIIVAGGYVWAVQPRKDKFKLGYISIGKIDAFGSVK
ncbi:GH25 family lysozyme [Enterococcus songbeiensis]